MKHQQVSVDYWAMGKTMVTYAILAAMGWLMLRLFNIVFMLPRRLRSQQENIQNTLAELQKRFPDLNITEQDLKDAEKDLEQFLKENDDIEKSEEQLEDKEKIKAKLEENTGDSTEISQPLEDKKTI